MVILDLFMAVGVTFMMIGMVYILVGVFNYIFENLGFGIGLSGILLLLRFAWDIPLWIVLLPMLLQIGLSLLIVIVVAILIATQGEKVKGKMKQLEDELKGRSE